MLLKPIKRTFQRCIDYVDTAGRSSAGGGIKQGGENMVFSS